MMRSRRRVILVVVGAACLSTGLGFAAGAQVISPAERAARTAPPPASPVTVPVESRLLESQVVSRGDTSFAGAIDVRVETADMEAPAIVTGAVPQVGATVNEGNVLLQVAGRPVLALVGDLPTYRTLRPGSTGPDVTQLENTLERLGLDPGPADGTYTGATGDAVAELFERSGFEPPEPDATDAELAEAQAAVTMAGAGVTSAKAALAAVQRGPSEAEAVAAQVAVNDAARVLQQAQAGGDANEIAAAADQLTIAQAEQRDLHAPVDTTEQQAAVTAAQAELDSAKSALQTAEEAAGTPLPAAEVVFLPTLPRRVDEVTVAQGQVIDGPVMRVSGAELIVTARVGSADRQLISEGMPAVIEHPGLQVNGHVTGINRTSDAASAGTDEGADSGVAAGDGGFDVVVTPDGLSPEQVEQLRESNVKVTIPISATTGEVLAVPLAALSVGADGTSRVEIVTGGVARVVSVEVGLSAGGYAEIRAPDTAIEPGDLVVVGSTA